MNHSQDNREGVNRSQRLIEAGRNAKAYIVGRTFKPHALKLAAARDLQLQLFAAIGVIKFPTDADWNEARAKIGMKPLKITPHCDFT